MMRLEKITPGDGPGVGRSNARIVKASSNISEIPENRNTEAKNVAAIQRVLSWGELSLTLSNAEPDLFLPIYCLYRARPRLQYRSDRLRELIEDVFQVNAEQALAASPSDVICWISWLFRENRRARKREDRLYVRSCGYSSREGI